MTDRPIVAPTPIVAVTGATGFLGRHLVSHLIGRGLRVRVLARRPPTHPSWPPEWQGLDLDLDLDVVGGDLDDHAALDRLVAGAGAVIHAAGLIKARNAAAFLHINADGAAAVAGAARRSSPQARFIHVSSLAAREPGLSDYAASKRAGEDAVAAVYATAAHRLTIVRPPMIYGPGDRETLAIFKTAAQPVIPLVSRGRLAAVHVGDAVATLAALATRPAPLPGTYALADTQPEGYAMLDMLRQAARAMGRTGTAPVLLLPAVLIRLAGGASGLWGRLRGTAPIFTAGKAREILHPDWTVRPQELPPPDVHHPTRGLAEGFRQTVAWYRAAGWL